MRSFDSCLVDMAYFHHMVDTYKGQIDQRLQKVRERKARIEELETRIHKLTGDVNDLKDDLKEENARIEAAQKDRSGDYGYMDYYYDLLRATAFELGHIRMAEVRNGIKMKDPKKKPQPKGRRPKAQPVPDQDFGSRSL